MSINPIVLLSILIAGVAIGALGGWLAAHPVQIRLQTELEVDRAVHAERIRAYQEAEATFREAFQSLAAEALQTNNRAFLDLAEIRLRDARTEASTDIDARRKAIEDLLAPLQKTLEQVDRDLEDSLRAAPRRSRPRADAAHRLARHDGAEPPVGNTSSRGCAQPAGRPRPLGRAPAQASRRARRHDRALRFRGAAHAHGQRYACV